MFKNTKPFWSLILALGVTATIHAVTIPQVLQQTASKGPIAVTLDVSQGIGPVPQVAFEVEVKNTADHVVELPGCAVEPGLHFLLVDSRGRTLLDAARSRCGNGIQMLVPGGTLRHQIDLSRRPLFVPNDDGTDAGQVVEGLLSPELRDLHFVDLVVSQDAAQDSVELPAVRIHLLPATILEATAEGVAFNGRDRQAVGRFAALERAVDPDTAVPLPYPGFPVTDDGAIRPLARIELAPVVGPEKALGYVPGQLLVTFREGVPLETAIEIVEAAGFKIVAENLYGFRILTVAVPVTLEDDAAWNLEGAPEVEAAHRNGIVTIF